MSDELSRNQDTPSDEASPFHLEIMMKAQEMTEDRFRFCPTDHPMVQKIKEWSFKRCAQLLSEGKLR